MNYKDEIDEALRNGVSRRRQWSRLAMLLDEAYPDPSALTLEEHARLSHSDIKRLSNDEMDRERLACLFRWAFAAEVTPWLEERRARLEAEFKRRKAAKG